MNGRRFVLIDHSITGLGGHYYEYAVHVLTAAGKAGFTPVLAANRKFRSAGRLDFPTYPAYKYGFWSVHSAGSFEEAAAGARRIWSRFATRVRCRWQYSAFGVAFALRERLSDLLFGRPIDAARAGFLLRIAPLVVAIKCARPITLVAILPLVWAAGLLRSLGRLMDPQRAVVRYLAPLAGDIRALLAGARGLLSAQSSAGIWLRQYRCLRRFAKDTSRLLDKLRLEERDIVFVPTVSAIELMALARVLETRGRRPGPSWHLVFRRNIYTGRESQYHEQEPAIEPMRQVFLRARQRIGGARVVCYTDTGELTAQYARLRAFDFRTLPIPHTTTPESGADSAPLRVVYCGDARFEKGYHLLPRIVRSVWADYVETGKLQFIFQSNYNIPNGEPEAVIARSQLQALPDHKVTLLCNALSSAEYRRLIATGHINLLLYDRDNYYARSSGILVESLACGVPVIVPSGTWLARQFLSELYSHQESLRQQLPLLQTLAGESLQWFTHGAGVPRGSSRTAGIDAAGKTCAWIRVPEDAALLLISAVFEPECQEAILTLVQTAGKDETIGVDKRLVEAEPATGRMVALVTIRSRAGKIWLAVQPVRGPGPIRLLHLRLDFLAAPAGYPIGAVGLAYDDVEEVPGLLANLADHYEHYRRTARAFASTIYARHNGPELVRCLDASASPASEPLLTAVT